MTAPRTLSTIAVAIALSVSTADAQNINFSSTGMFSGAGCAVRELTATYASCTDVGGIQLRYTFGLEQVLIGEGTAQFGTFATSGSGPSTFSNVLFALTIEQSSPTPGASMLSAAITGTVATTAGGLIWGPLDPTTFSIGNINYTISTDALTDGVRIGAPGESGVPSSPQSIRGFVTTTSVAVPEPGTLALLLVGVAGVTLASRRRRTA